MIIEKNMNKKGFNKVNFILVAMFLCLSLKGMGEVEFDKKEAFKALDEGYYNIFADYISNIASLGHPDAQYLYYSFATYKPYKGKYYPFVLSKLSKEEAYRYIEELADKGDIRAIGEMGFLYNMPPQESNIKKNRNKSFEYLKKAEGLNNPDIDLALGYHYLGQRDSISGSLPKARACFNNAIKHGGKHEYWEAIEGLASTYFLDHNYKEAGKLYEKWLKKYKSQMKLTEEGKYEKIDPDFNYPHIVDFIYAIESFIREKGYQKLNLIPNINEYSGFFSGFSYPDEEYKFNFNSWTDLDSDIYKKMNILSLVESYLLAENVTANSDFLRDLECLKLFYSLYNEPDAIHSYRRAIYYEILGNKARGLEYLKKAVEQDHFKASLLLGVRYYYGIDGYDKNLELAYSYLMPAERELRFHWKNLSEGDIAKGAYILAMLYYSNDTPAFDYKEALRFAAMFINEGYTSDETALGDIYRLLAKCYRWGYGVEADAEKASAYSERAASYGEPNETKILEWLKRNDKDKQDKKEE